MHDDYKITVISVDTFYLCTPKICFCEIMCEDDLFLEILKFCSISVGFFNEWVI